MESETENGNVSFLELLMAPDDSPIDNPYVPETISPEIQLFSSVNYSPQIHQTHYNFLSSCDMNNNSQFAYGNNYGDNIYHNTENTHNTDLFIPPSLPLFQEFYSACETDGFSVLPDLLSLEAVLESPPPKLELPSPKPQLLQPLPLDNYSLDSILNEFMKQPTGKVSPAQEAPRVVAPPRRIPVVPRSYKRARVRDKMYDLSKLLPAGYGRKNAMADTLEDTYKYVKFLQAQVGALQSMPSGSLGSEGGGGEGKLMSLTRQQLLQVVVNTPEAQVMMAEKGLCVVSDEQIEHLKRVEFKKQLVLQLLAQIPL